MALSQKDKDILKRLMYLAIVAAGLEVKKGPGKTNQSEVSVVLIFSTTALRTVVD